MKSPIEAVTDAMKYQDYTQDVERAFRDMYKRGYQSGYLRAWRKARDERELLRSKAITAFTVHPSKARQTGTKPEIIKAIPLSALEGEDGDV